VSSTFTVFLLKKISVASSQNRFKREYHLGSPTPSFGDAYVQATLLVGHLVAKHVSAPDTSIDKILGGLAV
jgi:hypothetical protein